MYEVLTRTEAAAVNTTCHCCGKKLKRAVGLSDGNLYGPTCAGSAIFNSRRVVEKALGLRDDRGYITEIGKGHDAAGTYYTFLNSHIANR